MIETEQTAMYWVWRDLLKRISDGKPTVNKILSQTQTKESIRAARRERYLSPYAEAMRCQRDLDLINAFERMSPLNPDGTLTWPSKRMLTIRKPNRYGVKVEP